MSHNEVLSTETANKHAVFTCRSTDTILCTQFTAPPYVYIWTAYRNLKLLVGLKRCKCLLRLAPADTHGAH